MVARTSTKGASVRGCITRGDHPQGQQRQAERVERAPLVGAPGQDERDGSRGQQENQQGLCCRADLERHVLPDHRFP